MVVKVNTSSIILSLSNSYILYIVKEKGYNVTHFVSGITYGGTCDIKFKNVTFFYTIGRSCFIFLLRK